MDKQDKVVSLLRDYLPEEVLRGVPTINPLRLAHLLSQCSHESAGFKSVRENLNYSVEGLMKIFPKYFPTLEIAQQFAKQPQKIANKVYANRMGNGDEASGDGYKFRGRGYLQITGKNNYIEFGKYIKADIITSPDRVATEFPLQSASWFFERNGIYDIADEGATDIVVKKVTRKINGGTIGLEDRIKRFNEFYRILTGYDKENS